MDVVKRERLYAPIIGLVFIILCATATPLWGWSKHESARTAQLQGGVELSIPRTLGVSGDTLQCFGGSQGALLNPGCFATVDPSQPGDCTSRSSHFLVQYLFPDPLEMRRLRGFAFLSNDGDTVFPSAGALLIPIENGSVRFPTAAELANLQVTNVASSGDTSQVFVDLFAEEILVGPESNVALVLVLQFPEGGQLTAATQGPAIAADTEAPNADCDFFTIDGGASGTWFAPAYDPGDPNSLPLDWGFLALFGPLTVAVEEATWTHVKRLYQAP
jgi:hypothetical protein